MAKRFTHDDIDKFYEYGIDVPNRTIYMGEADYDFESGQGTGVDFKMAEMIIKGLHILDMKAPNGDQPITIIANNPGGSWYDGMAIYGAIKACKNHVTIKMFGYAMSMGSIIPQAADERIMDPYARFMIHYGSEGMHSTHSKNFEKWGDETKKVNHMMENIYLDRMLEKDTEMTERGEAGYLDRVMSEIANTQHAMDFPPLEKPIKYKFSVDSVKRREDIRKALKELLDYDSCFSAEETVALGLANKVLEY